ncbi:MAG TPA: hypothetical protein VHW67_04445 [Solirubrobacteraceae bacterium]|nr:hypothetical protein [Solirubrobacteraceae bacterium]
MILTPLFGYNRSRDAYVIRGVGRHVGPVLRPNRRVHRERNRRPWLDRSWHELSGEGLVSADALDSADRVERQRASWA